MAKKQVRNSWGQNRILHSDPDPARLAAYLESDLFEPTPMKGGPAPERDNLREFPQPILPSSYHIRAGRGRGRHAQVGMLRPLMGTYSPEFIGDHAFPLRNRPKGLRKLR